MKKNIGKLCAQMSINIGISTLATENDQDYGWKALGAVSGTLGSNYVSKIRFGNRYGDTFARPILSEYASEFLGDSNKVEYNFKKLRGNNYEDK